MDKVLGLDCDDNEIFEFRILRTIWSNDIDIRKLDGADPRYYCAVFGEDGNAYAISVYDWQNKDLIREREHLSEDEEIPVIVKPISEMSNYECAITSDGDHLYYDLDYKELKSQLNTILKAHKLNKVKKLGKYKGEGKCR